MGFSIGLVSGPWSAELVLGLWPRTNTADLRPVTVPIQNHLIKKAVVAGPAGQRAPDHFLG